MLVAPEYQSPKSILYDFLTEEVERGGDVDRPVSHDDCVRNANLALASCFRRLVQAKIMLSDGRVVSVDQAFLGRLISEQPFHHAFFNLHSGVVGETTWTYRNEASRMLRNILTWKTLASVVAAVIFGVALGVLLTAYCDVCANGIEDLVKPSVTGLYLVVGLLGVAPIILALFLVQISLLQIKRRAFTYCRGFQGGHLMIHQGAVRSFIRLHYSVDAAEQPNPEHQDDAFEELPESEERCAFAIVAAHDQAAASGAKLKKEEARERFGETVSSGRAFVRAWELARRMRPEIGAGGRPKTKAR